MLSKIIREAWMSPKRFAESIKINFACKLPSRNNTVYLNNVRSLHESFTGNPVQARYTDLIASGVITSDPDQIHIIMQLDKLTNQLNGYESTGTVSNTSGRKGEEKSLVSFFSSRLFSNSAVSTIIAPKGMYIYGDVGAGKTMVMDMFYSTVNVKLRRRVHFNAFMLDVHSRIHKWKMSREKNSSR